MKLHGEWRTEALQMFAFSFSEAPFGMEQITLLVHRQNKSNFGLK
jgi:hypothetical protein